MELNKMEELLEKFFDGTSNDEEEQTLRTYFSQENIAGHLIQYRTLFSYFAEAKQIKNEREIMLKSAKNPQRNKAFILSIAATLIVALGVGIFMFTTYKPTNDGDLGTFDDPKIALEETQKALSMLSRHVNTGYASVGYIEEFEITRDKIFNLDY